MSDDPQLLAARREWLRRVEAEYRSATIASHLTLWLMQLTAPFELTRMGLAIVDDELVHAELSQRVHEAAGGCETVAFEPSSLGIRRPSQEPLARAVARASVEFFCLGETVAVRLFSKLREGCNQSAARTALDRILKDEVRHRDFGWTMLEWLLSSPLEASTRELIASELPSMFERQRTAYAFAHLGRKEDRSDSERHWGRMPPAAYARALQETFERDYIPRFADFDVDARAAWERSAS